MSETGEKGGKGGDSYLFQHLVVMFQSLALQQMGKLMNPVTGKVERDLHQARITIDMLDMIQHKTRGNLEDGEGRLLNAILTELRMNFVDESGREEPEQENAGEEGSAEGRREEGRNEGEDSEEDAEEDGKAGEETRKGDDPA